MGKQKIKWERKRRGIDLVRNSVENKRSVNARFFVSSWFSFFFIGIESILLAIIYLPFLMVVPLKLIG
jgi:hypothetical protein